MMTTEINDRTGMRGTTAKRKPAPSACAATQWIHLSKGLFDCSWHSNFITFYRATGQP